MLNRNRNRLLVAAWVAFLIVGVTIALLPDIGRSGRALQMVPFRVFSELFDNERVGYRFVVRNVIGNFILFVPVGLIVGWLHDARRSARVVSITVLAVEAVQFVALERVADIDDVILATAGAYLAGLVGARARRALAMKPPHVNATALVLLGVGLLLSSCSGTDETSEPLEAGEVLAVLGFDSSDTGLEIRRGSVFDFETAVLECMREEGFNYPAGLVSGRDYETEDTSLLDVPYVDAEGRSLYDPEFVTEFGYGFTARAMHDAGVLTGGTVPGDDGGLDAQLSEELSIEEYEAFYSALGGDEGCVNSAGKASYYGTVTSTFQDILAAQDEDIDERVQATAEFAELENAWISCMANEGFTVAYGADLLVDIDAELNTIFATADDLTRASFDDVLMKEVDLATAELLECEGGPYAQAKYDRIRAAIEQEVVEANIDKFTN